MPRKALWIAAAGAAAALALTGTTSGWAQESAPTGPNAMRALTGDLAVPGTTWYTDPDTGRATVTYDDTVTGAAMARLRAVTGRLGGAVTVVHEPGILTRRSSGSGIHTAEFDCSLGFSGQKDRKPYFITAGHCGAAGAQWFNADDSLIGTVVDSQFPGVDYALVAYEPGAERAGVVDLGGGKVQDIARAGVARVGEHVTRKGQTTGVHSGTVTALDVTVNYPEGKVSGLVKTDVCAENGDSGGPLFDGTAAIGLLSGGKGDCTAGGVSYYQPVQPALEAFGIALY